MLIKWKLKDRRKAVDQNAHKVKSNVLLCAVKKF